MIRISGLVVTLTGLTAACSNSDGDRPPAPYESLYQGLCTARARATEPASARAVFFDRAHQQLHELASEATPKDRAASARLLEAKEAVERDLASADPALADDLDQLLDAARAAITTANHPPPGQCEENR